MFGISIEEDLVMANDFFSKMKDTIVKGANTVAGESGKLVERGKIKASVMKLEDQKKSLLMELGNKYYEAYKQDNTNSDEVRQICEQLDALHAEIEIKKEENENQPFRPEVAMPSTKYFCAAKKRRTSGRTATQAMAITRPHTTTLSASTERRSASEMVYFLTELMKIKELK